MLNELGEYEQYAIPLDVNTNFVGHRLKYFALIKNGFAGLERALTIIARHHIFEADFAAENVSSAFDEESVKNILRAWCGFEVKPEAKSTVPPVLSNYLPKYIRLNFLNDCLRECRLKVKDFPEDENFADLESFTALMANNEKSLSLKDVSKEISRVEKILTALDTLSGKAKSFERTIFNVLGDTGKEYRAIKYDRILANALFFGKLHDYVLVCEREPFSTEIRKVTKNKPTGKKLLSSQQDLVLKVTAVYLLQRRYSDQDFVTFNELNLINWLAKETKPENLDLETFVFADTAQSLFELKIIDGVNVKKLRVNPDWLRNFKLAEKSEVSKREYFGRIFFTDSGAAQPLTRLNL